MGSSFHLNIDSDLLTFIINMFCRCVCCFVKSHMYLISRVLPHPVSPMMMTGIPHLVVKICDNNPKKMKKLISMKFHTWISFVWPGFWWSCQYLVHKKGQGLLLPSVPRSSQVSGLYPLFSYWWSIKKKYVSTNFLVCVSWKYEILSVVNSLRTEIIYMFTLAMRKLPIISVRVDKHASKSWKVPVAWIVYIACITRLD